MNADRCWVWIVTKDGQYLKSVLYGIPKWSNNKSDAVQIDLFSNALKVAEKLGGEIRRLNTLTYDVR